MKRQLLHFEFDRGLQTLEIMVAATAPERMQGLLRRPPLRPDQAMLLRSCRLIHTIGMTYPLDLVYLRKDGTVLKVTPALPARRIDGHWHAHSVLEMAAGAAAYYGIAVGRHLPLASMTAAAAGVFDER
jgi:uncharacterized membrane protein (UPF0127 family)